MPGNAYIIISKTQIEADQEALLFEAPEPRLN
jgi:hypothetical protein